MSANLGPYAWLANEPGPAMLLEALKLYGTHETPGPGNNPVILGWAKEVGLGNVYKDDSRTPWCGLFQAVVAKRAGWDHNPKGNPLWALNWATWGNPSPQAMLGDVLVFQRKTLTGTAGHVGIYVAEDAEAYHVLGGNEQDMVTIVRIAKRRLVAARRAPWKVAQPANVRPIRIDVAAKLGAGEA